VSDRTHDVPSDPLAAAAVALTRRQALARLGLAGAGVALGGAYLRPAEALASLEANPTTLRWNVNAQPVSLDAATNNSGGAYLVAQLINEPLMEFDAKGHPIPWLAESVSNPSPTKFVYKIRQGVRFSDGSPLTAEDVAYSFARHLDPKLASQIGYYYGSVHSVRASGPHEVTFTLKSPDISFPLTTPIATYILKKSFAKPLGKDYARPGGKMVGTGPFLLGSYSSSGITVTRNPHYWGPKPPVDRIDYAYIGDPESELLALQNGSIDGTFGVSPQKAIQYARIPSVTLRGDLNLNAFLSMKVTSPPWNDVNVRRAVAHCWDGRGFVKGALQGLGQAVTGIVFPPQWHVLYSPAELKALYKSVPSYPFDFDAARAELRKSSTPNGFTASITFPTSLPDVGLALQSLSANLKRIGINLNVQGVTINQWLAEVYGHKSDFAVILYGGYDYPDPLDVLQNSLWSVNAVENGYNFAHYNNPTVDRLLKIARAPAAPAVRKKALNQIFAIAQRDLPYFDLFMELGYVAVRKPFGYKGFSTLWYYTPWIYHVTV